MNNLRIKAMGFAAFLFSFTLLPAQEAADTSQALPERTFKKIDLFPAISYAPETKLTLGGIGYYYLDLYRGSPATKISNINFLAVYTLNQQVALEGYWDIFTDGNRWRTRGMAFYNKYPYRNYGRGNEPGVPVVEYLEKFPTSHGGHINIEQQVDWLTGS